jgi:ribosomal protein S18 acetylase RimI-like enzyme
VVTGLPRDAARENSPRLDALLERARKDGFKRISLSVEKTNPAVHLYENRGFRTFQGDGDLLMVAELGALT